MNRDALPCDPPPALAADDAPEDEAPPELCDDCGGSGLIRYSFIDCRACCGEGVIRCAKT